MNETKLKSFLDSKAAFYNTPDFISNDPICIPKMFSKKQDIEIMGFFAATLAWGQRKTIITNCKKLIELMEGSPLEFILQHQEKDLSRFEGFVHRTFNDTDLLYFIAFFRDFYQQNESLESAFFTDNLPQEKNIEQGLIAFQHKFFSLPYALARTRKHVASPERKSACKRINMFLRWMVREDQSGVDFGIWKKIKPAQLICPLDTHVHRVATGLGLIKRNQADWQTAVELTETLKRFDANDPVKYDFALFGLGVEERY